MNRFDPTVVISLDGIHNQSSLKFLDAISSAMDERGIPFAQHWARPTVIPRSGSATGSGRTMMPGSRRHQLLGDPADRELFTNDFMTARGLAA